MFDLGGFETHLESRGVSRNTIRAYLSDLKDFEEFMTQNPSLSLKTAVEQFLSQFSKLSTKKRKFESIKAYARWKEIGEVLAIKMKWGREMLLPRVLNIKELSEFEREAKIYSAERGDPFILAAIMLMSTLGLRAGEVLNLRVKDIDLKGMTIRIRGKGKKDAVLPLPSKLKQILRRVIQLKRDAGPETLLFHFSYWTLNRRVKEIGERVGRQDITPHTLRHTAATGMLRKGINLRVVQKVLRHASIATTQKYTHLTVDDIRKELVEKGW